MSLQLTILTIDINEMTSSPMVEVFNQDIVSIGRKAAENDVVLNRSEISGKHLQIRVDKSQGKERIFVMDLGSLNGTSIEGKLLEPNVERELRQGQRIGVGSYIIRPLIVEDIYEEEGSRDEIGKISKKKESTIVEDSSSDSSIESSSKYFEMVGNFSFDSEHAGSGSICSSGYDDEKSENDSHIVINTNTGTFHEVADSNSSYDTNYEAEDEDEYKEGYEDEEGISEELIDPLEQEESENDGISYDDEDNGSVEEDSLEENEEEDKDEEVDEYVDEDEVIVEDNFVNKEDFVEEDEVIEEENFVSKEDLVEEENDEDEEVSEIAASRFQDNDFTVKDVFGTSDVIFDFEGTELFHINGKIIHNGKPLAGVKIEVGNFGSVVSDERGEFVIDDIEEGSKYKVVPSMNKYTFECESGASSGTLNDNIDLVFQAKELCVIEGIVKRRKGTPIPHVEIDGGRLGTVISDEEGRFVFNNVLEGTRYTLSLKKDKFQFIPADNSGVVTKDISLNLIGNKLLKIDGYIRNKGVPIEGVRVDAGAIGVTVTDQNGYYCFDNIPEGTEYEITLSKEGYKFGRPKK